MKIRNLAHPSLQFAWAQIAEGENDNQELLQRQIGQEENRHLRENTHYKLLDLIDFPPDRLLVLLKLTCGLNFASNAI